MSAIPTSFSQEELKSLLDNLHTFAPAEQAQILEIIDELEQRQHAEKCRTDLIEFAKHMMPDYKVGPHHKQLAQYLEDLAYGRKDRITVSIAPRFGKSQLTSIFFPAWFIGNWPDKKIMIVSHTADLAVDFGRKVRNLINSEEYKAVFQDVALAADSKSAGRWNTNKGGEFFACLRLHTKVSTTRGVCTVDEVQVGDTLLNCGSGAVVQKIYRTSHESTYNISGLECSAEHPIWTETRGWVYACDVRADDLLIVENFLDILKAQLRRAYGYLGYSNVPSLVQHQVTLHEPKQPKVVKLRRARDHALRAVANVREFFSRYGATAWKAIHHWANRQQWALQPRELSLGNTSTARQQPQDQSRGGRKNHGRACSYFRDNARSYSVSPESWSRPSITREETTEELRTYDPPENKGWLRSIGVWFFKRGILAVSKPTECYEKYLARVRRAAQKLQGFLLGVCPAGYVKITHHDDTPFVNFLLSGDHTFFADGVLTHNCGVGGALAGRGAHLLVIDDCHNEQEVLNGNFEIFEKAYEWYAYGARTRLMPNGSVAIIGTRWAEQDLIGQVQKDMLRNPDADQWDVVEFPALLEKKGASAEDDETERYISLWPEQWSLESLLRTKASMPPFQWSAQYMQQPTSRDAAIIKREWWNEWDKDDPPPCDYVIMSLDAAAEKTNRSDFTALTTWGVFYMDDENGQSQANIILLNSIKERLEFPELKRLAYAQYQHWEPDWFIIERKSSGSPLYQEMRRGGIPVQDYTPHRGTGDKVMRLNSVSDIFATGLVWYPAGRRWAEEVVDEVCGFPAMPHDDLVDSTVMALMRFRDGGFIRLPSDIWEDDHDFTPVRASYY